MFVYNLQQMFKEVNLTGEDEQFLNDTINASSRSGKELDVRKIIIEMYSIKHAEKNTYALINSNKELAESNNKHAKAMRHLTVAIVLVGVAQVTIAALAFYFNL